MVDGPTDWSGRIEVYHDGAWGTVCDDFWQDADAQVVCRQLGLTGGTAYGRAAFGEGSGEILLDEVECIGSEEGLLQCVLDVDPWGYHDCEHHEDAGVGCGMSTSLL